jgi:hypothetical protein
VVDDQALTGPIASISTVAYTASVVSGSLASPGGDAGASNRLFDGDTATSIYSAGSGSGLEATVKITPTITGITTLRMFAGADPSNGSGGFRVNGRDYSHLLTTPGNWVAIPEATLDTFTLRNVTAAHNVSVGAIEVNGLLVTSGMRLSFATDRGLSHFRVGDTVVELGNGDEARGTVSAVDVAGRALTLIATTGVWDVGSAVKGPEHLALRLR